MAMLSDKRLPYRQIHRRSLQNEISPGAMLCGISAPSMIAAIGALIQLDCVGTM